MKHFTLFVSVRVYFQQKKNVPPKVQQNTDNEIQRVLRAFNVH